MEQVQTQSLSEEQIRRITVDTIKRMKEFIKEEQEKKEQAESNNSIYVPAEPPFYFAVRIRSSNRARPEIRKALSTLRLHTNINTGAFVINNSSSKTLLQQVRSYIAFGTLSLETIRELIYKRGLCRYKSQRKNITQEVLFDRFGGEISTVEEIVEALFLGKPNATEINKWLWPFKLNSPSKGFGGRKIRDFTDGGSTGDHGKYLDNLVRRMI